MPRDQANSSHTCNNNSHHKSVTKKERKISMYMKADQAITQKREVIAKFGRRSNRLTAGVAVKSEVVLGARRKASDLVLGGQGLDAGGESGRGLLALESKKVGSETSNVGRSHGGTRDGVL